MRYWGAAYAVQYPYNKAQAGDTYIYNTDNISSLSSNFFRNSSQPIDR